MDKVSATIAVAVAFAVVPSASIAQGAPKAAPFGFALIDEDKKVKVAAVKPGGTAALMGMRPGDVITHAGGKRINATYKLSGFIRGLKAGDAVELTVEREKKSLQLTGTAK